MEARMNNPALIVPEALPALLAVGKVIAQAGVPKQTLKLVNLRASQINGCSVCVYGHARALQQAGERDERLWAVAAWRDAPFFSAAERAALALAEAVTRLSDRAAPVPDAVWNEAARHYDEVALGAFVLSIGMVNLWNRLNVATAQVAGADWS